MYFNRVQNKLAFTLAEVLITLGIIGIVAAMTIPNLIANNRARVLHAKFQKSYSVISQMIRRMQDDEIALDTKMLNQIKYYITGATYCGYSATILNHEKDDTPCFYKSNGEYKSFDGKSTIRAGIMDDAQWALPDGSILLFEWDTQHYSDGSHCWIWTDINGAKNPPNRLGVDLFVFQIVDGKLLAMGDTGTLYTDTDKYCNATAQTYLNGMACTHLAKNDTEWFKKVVKLK